MNVSICWALVGVLALAPAAQAQVYKWIDERGTTSYGSKPPPNARRVTQLTEADSRVSIIPTARPQAAAPLRERDLDVRLARVERERDAPVIAADRLSVAEAEWRERCFTERRVSCTPPTAATHDIMPSFAPLPYSPLR
jgi:Domain of unknown function (DUF4124)